MESPTLTEFYIACHTQKHIVALDISMDDFLLVQMFQTLGNLPRNSSNLPLSHKIRSDYIRQWTTLQVLHDDPHVIFVQKRVNVVDYIGMARGPHDPDLIDNEVFLGLFVEVHLFNRYG
jgi:hypothetical protein